MIKFIICLLPFLFLGCNKSQLLNNNINTIEVWTAHNDSMLSTITETSSIEKVSYLINNSDKTDTRFIPEYNLRIIYEDGTNENIRVTGEYFEINNVSYKAGNEFSNFFSTAMKMSLSDKNAVEKSVKNNEVLKHIISNGIKEYDTIIVNGPDKYKIHIKGYQDSTRTVEVEYYTRYTEGMKKEIELWYDNTVKLSISKNGNVIIYKEINKEDFCPEIVPKEYLKESYLSYFDLEEMTDSSFIFTSWVGTPDTDVGNYIKYEVTLNGRIYTEDITDDDL